LEPLSVEDAGAEEQSWQWPSLGMAAGDLMSLFAAGTRAAVEGAEPGWLHSGAARQAAEQTPEAAKEAQGPPRVSPGAIGFLNAVAAHVPEASVPEAARPPLANPSASLAERSESSSQQETPAGHPDERRQRIDEVQDYIAQVRRREAEAMDSARQEEAAFASVS